MDLFSLLPFLVVHLYALGVVVLVLGFLAGRDRLRRPAAGILVLAFLVHTLLLLVEFAGMDTEEPARSLFIQFLAWCLASAGLGVARKWRSYALLLVVAPIIPAIFLLARLSGTAVMPIPPALAGMLSAGHIFCLFLSFGCLTAAFGAGILFLIQEKSIKSKAAPSEFQKELPALNVLDAINAAAVHVGFPLFTLGILLGFTAGRLTWGHTLTDPKEWVSLAIWGLFAGLYHQRLAHGARGRKPALLAIWIFLICLFSLTAVNMFLSTHHGFFNPQR